MKIKSIVLAAAFLVTAGIRTTDAVSVEWKTSTRTAVEFTARGYFGEAPPEVSYPSNGTMENGLFVSPNGLWRLEGPSLDFFLHEAVGGYGLGLMFSGSLPKDDRDGFRLDSPTFGTSFEDDWSEGEGFLVEADSNIFGEEFIWAWGGQTRMYLIINDTYPPAGDSPWEIIEPFTLEWRIEAYASGPRLPSGVPDGGATAALLGFGVAGMALVRRKIA